MVPLFFIHFFIKFQIHGFLVFSFIWFPPYDLSFFHRLNQICPIITKIISQMLRRFRVSPTSVPKVCSAYIPLALGSWHTVSGLGLVFATFMHRWHVCVRLVFYLSACVLEQRRVPPRLTSPLREPCLWVTQRLSPSHGPFRGVDIVALFSKSVFTPPTKNVYRPLCAEPPSCAPCLWGLTRCVLFIVIYWGSRRWPREACVWVRDLNIDGFGGKNTCVWRLWLTPWGGEEESEAIAKEGWRASGLQASRKTHFVLG